MAAYAAANAVVEAMGFVHGYEIITSPYTDADTIAPFLMQEFFLYWQIWTESRFSLIQMMLPAK